MRLPIGRSSLFFSPEGRGGCEAADRIAHERYFSGSWLCRSGGSRNLSAWRYLAAGSTGVSRSKSGLSCALSRRCHHGASGLAAHRRPCIFLACDRRKRGRGSEEYKEQDRNGFGEEFHASVINVFILSVQVCDLTHTIWRFSQTSARIEGILATPKESGQSTAP
jgi:hypothetical protein